MHDQGPSATRIEHDLLGAQTIPGAALYGVHTARALANFGLARRPVHVEMIRAYGSVKRACTRTNRMLGYLDQTTGDALEHACEELESGQLDGHILVDALQGGAGTSLNMNVNEVLTNRALQQLGLEPGQYDRIDPHQHANLHQSTNDTFPTALRVAAMRRLAAVERALIGLVTAFQDKEHELAHVVKVGRTQLQDAVLTTLGRSMSAYAEAFGRDRWRVYKCEERLRVVNLGGTAIGTGLGAPRDYIFAVVDELRALTGLGLARAENLVDATQNVDVLVEVSGILKACASNLLKTCSDLRLMASGPEGGLGELRLPNRQAGSSIMPTKVNPVVPEAVTQAALRIIAHDQEITQAGSLGNLELNAFLPLVADALLDSLDLLERACTLLRTHCIEGLTADADRCHAQVTGATATLTALASILGYSEAEEIARVARQENKPVRDVVIERNILSADGFDQLISPESVMRLGSPPRRLP